MKSIRFTSWPALVLPLLILVASCSSESTFETDVTNDCLITAATMGGLKRTVTQKNAAGKDTTYVVNLTGALYPLYIDQLNNRIYNADSLPVGTHVEKTVFSAFNATGTVLIKSLHTDADTMFVMTDSTDCSVPRQLTVYSSDGLSRRTYRLEVNLHKEEGSVFAGCGELSFIDCEITGYANAIIRHQGNEGTGIDEVTVDNCYIHDFNLSGSSYALFMFKNADYYVGAFNITNSTFFNVGTNIIEHRLTDTAIHNCNATISDCTFQNCGSNSRTMFDFDKTATGTVTFENCVFGAIMDPSVHKGFRGSYVVTNVRNCYASDDFTFASSAGILGDIPKFGAPAADIFVDAAGGNLTLTGVAASYAGTIGDPRWY